MKPTIVFLAVLVISIVGVSSISDFEERNVDLPKLFANTMYKHPNHSFSLSMVTQLGSVIVDN